MKLMKPILSMRINGVKVNVEYDEKRRTFCYQGVEDPSVFDAGFQSFSQCVRGAFEKFLARGPEVSDVR